MQVIGSQRSGTRPRFGARTSSQYRTKKLYGPFRCVRSKLRILLAIPILCGQPTVALGQAVRGTVRESKTDRAVENARIMLLDEAGDTLATALSDDRGHFLAGLANWGSFVVSIIRLGYQPFADGPVRLVPGDTLEVVYELQPLAVHLEPITVQEAAVIRRLMSVGFYHRQRKGFGYHMDADAMGQRRGGAQSIADLMVGLPGVRIVYRGGGQFGKTVELTGMPSLVATCSEPQFYVDGVRLVGGGVIEEVVRPMDVLAIEIYTRPSQLPVQYTSAESGCGVILIWTGRSW